jgi:F-type H+-transporting ATPase subunit delta
MKISSRQYAQSLYEVTKGKSNSEIKSVLHNFVTILGNSRALNKTAEIIADFQKIWNEENGELAASLTSAHELSPTTVDLIVDYLKTKTGTKKVSLTEQIDKDLIGGFVLRYDDQIIDGSLKNNLADLKNKISN